MGINNSLVNNTTQDFSKPKLSDKLSVEPRFWNGRKVYLVLDPEKPVWLTLNEDGLSILRRCDGEHSVQQIARKIGHEFSISHDEALRGISNFLAQLQNNMLLQDDTSEKDQEIPERNKFHSLAMEITRKCNLRCKHCFLAAGEKDRDELSLSKIKSIMDQVKAAGGISVSIGGGEPLLHPDWLEIVEYALSLGLLVALGSNGTLIDKEFAAKIANLPIKLQVSLDGACQVTHDHIRGVGSFDGAMQGIDNLLAVGKGSDLVIAYTPMKTNIDEVAAFIQLVQELGINIIQFPTLTRAGRAVDQWHNLQPTCRQQYELWQYLSECRIKLRGVLDIISDCFSLNINTPGKAYRCSIGNQLRMAPNGDLYPCQCFHFGDDFLLGNIKNDDLGTIIQSERLKCIITDCLKRPDMIPGCATCNWRNFCGAGCMGNAYEATGSALEPDRCSLRKKWIESLFDKEAGVCLSR